MGYTCETHIRLESIIFVYNGKLLHKTGHIIAMGQCMGHHHPLVVPLARHHHCVSLYPYDLVLPDGVPVLARNHNNQWICLGELNVGTSYDIHSHGSFDAGVSHCLLDDGTCVSCTSDGYAYDREFMPIVHNARLPNLPSSRWEERLDNTCAPDVCRGYKTVYVAYHLKYMENVVISDKDGTLFDSRPTNNHVCVGFHGLQFTVKDGKLTNPKHVN